MEWTLGALYSKLEATTPRGAPAHAAGASSSYVPTPALLAGLILAGFVAHHLYMSYCARGPPARKLHRAVEPRDSYTPVARR